MYSMLTRSQRISHENLRLRDPMAGRFERWFAQRAGMQRQPGQAHRRRRCSRRTPCAA
jgi:anthraniloyl-CoA monooxygenase